jgi:hypothetical protein
MSQKDGQEQTNAGEQKYIDADGHTEINFDNIHNLTIKDGELYWKKHKLTIETTQKFVFSLWQKISGILLLIAALASPLVTYVANLANICKYTGGRFPYCGSIEESITPAPLVAYTVFFGDGTARISVAQMDALREFLHPLAACDGVILSARGFASSAPYPENSDLRNIMLSSQRVQAVVTVAETMGVHVSGDQQWDSLKSMVAARAFQDSEKGNKSRLPDREAFNRRVELRVTSYGACGK